jgi:hypothetical protein
MRSTSLIVAYLLPEASSIGCEHRYHTTTLEKPAQRSRYLRQGENPTMFPTFDLIRSCDSLDKGVNKILNTGWFLIFVILRRDYITDITKTLDVGLYIIHIPQ